MINVVTAKCVDKKIDYEFIREWVFFGKKIPNPNAKRYLYFEIDNKEYEFIVDEINYKFINVGDEGNLEYEIISNTYKIVRFSKEF